MSMRNSSRPIKARVYPWFPSKGLWLAQITTVHGTRCRVFHGKTA